MYQKICSVVTRYILCKVSSQVKERPHIFEHFQVLKKYLLCGKIASAKYFWNEEVEKAINFMERDIFGYYRTVVSEYNFRGFR
jgi:hypothetical protein